MYFAQRLIVVVVNELFGMLRTDNWSPASSVTQPIGKGADEGFFDILGLIEGMTDGFRFGIRDGLAEGMAEGIGLRKA